MRIFDAVIGLINNHNKAIDPINELDKKSKLDKILILINEFNQELNDLENDYITQKSRILIKKKYHMVFKSINLSFILTKNQDLVAFKQSYLDLDKYVENCNNKYLKKFEESSNNYFNNVMGVSLDNQQKQAVIATDRYSLVIAGAGSGKTVTIIAKVKYLIEKKNVKPDEILVLAFNSKVSKEINEKLNNKMKFNVSIKTFHKFGLDVLKKKATKKIDVSDSMDGFLNNFFVEEVVKKENLAKYLTEYFAYYVNKPFENFEYDDFGEYILDQKNFDFETIKGKNLEYSTKYQIEDLKKKLNTINQEVVKSAEELMIANFLYLNNVNYEYEQMYKYTDDNYKYKSYRPDFYLIDYDIYLEHFGITKDGKVPWLSEVEETKYLDGIIWKRNIHKENNTVLLETYSYYNDDGKLLEKLEKKLLDNKVELKPVNYQEIYKKLYQNSTDKKLLEFKKLISTFINLYKTKYQDQGKFSDFLAETKNIKSKFKRNKTLILLTVSYEFYKYYQLQLKENNLYDFNDMLNKAEEELDSSYFKTKLKYVIVDEYQDVSYSRYKILKKICELNDSSLMAVGDDWQSIYRFAGSDINLLTHFSSYFEYPKLISLENTYRNSKELIKIASKFIQKNPMQIKKRLKSNKSLTNSIKIIGYDSEVIISFKMIVKAIVDKFTDQKEILVLGRNNFDLNSIVDNEEITLKITNNKVLISYSEYPNLKIKYMSVHKAKGIESDNVIVLNNSNNVLGFPNKISDDILLSYVIDNNDEILYAEERRLFYVALSRSKNFVYLLAPLDNYSEFIVELLKMGVFEFNKHNNNSRKDRAICPKCNSGYLVKRKNNHNGSYFLACSNYPNCDYMSKYVNILTDKKICPDCHGYLVKRKGKFGYFYGCNNYPLCNYTEIIKK